MLAAEHYPDLFADVAPLRTNELLDVHRSKISLHHAKAGYSYPTIRLHHARRRPLDRGNERHGEGETAT